MDDVVAPASSISDPLASDLVVACESVWRSIQRGHPELPPAVMLLGSGVERGRLVKLGHWWGGRWLADGEVRGEVLLAGEALHMQPEDVFEVLLHEAAHGINAARGIKDTSRGGRYHNAQFKNTALEVGLSVEQVDPYGFAQTAIRPETAERYATEIADLATAMRLARRVPGSALVNGGNGKVGETDDAGRDDLDPGGGSRRSKVRPAECGCGRRMRMAPSVLAKGPVICGSCDTEFLTDSEPRRPVPTSVANHLDSQTKDGMGGTNTAGSEALLQWAAARPDGLDVVLRLGQWRSTFGRENERPLPISEESERATWDQLARAVMSADGLLEGAAVTLHEALDLRVGDRVVVTQAGQDGTQESLPCPGTPGVVVGVDTKKTTATVDFPTAGVYEVRKETQGATLLAYNYCQVDATTPPLTLSPGDRARQEPDGGTDLGVDL